MANFGFYRYCELAIDEEKLASHFIENPSFQHIHHSVEVFVFYYMLKFGGHILLRNTCPVPVRHQMTV